MLKSRMHIPTSSVLVRYDRFSVSTAVSSKSVVRLSASSPCLATFSLATMTKGMTFFMYFFRLVSLPRAPEIILLSGKALLLFCKHSKPFHLEFIDASKIEEDVTIRFSKWFAPFFENIDKKPSLMKTTLKCTRGSDPLIREG